MKPAEDTVFLTVDEVIYLHGRGIDLYGGSHGIRDFGLVESATLAAQQSFGGEFLCQSIEEMATTYWFNLANNHGFIDGNKRVALRAADVFLARNGFDLNLSQEEAAVTTERVAAGEVSKLELLEIVKQSVTTID